MARWQKQKKVIDRTTKPITSDRIIQDLAGIGLTSGDVVVVHSSLSRMGWVVGGPVTVINAMMQVVTVEGTIAMPTHTSGNSEPTHWVAPPVPEDWWPIIRIEMPAYQPSITPADSVGIIPETFRGFPDVLRSKHPQASVAAWGKNAEEVVKTHRLEMTFGTDSPWDRLYDLNAKVLLIGVEHISNTSLHLAEVKAALPNQPTELQGAAIEENGERVWKAWTEIQYYFEDFPQIGQAFEESIGYQPVKIGQAESRLLSMRALIDFAVDWLHTNRKYP
ncbi:MAG: aminoglycoside N(3)-acetyltransferase [Candidatus Thorarchaeota archaeon]|jgi:aminoglycoside 3-N-acetyltransferase